MAEKMTNSYETIFIIDASLEEDQIAAVKADFSNYASERRAVFSAAACLSALYASGQAE